jgi:hypothetical protein
MKKTILGLGVAAIMATGAHAGEIITQWNFNSRPPDGSSGTGTNVPSVGGGTAVLVGTTATFAAGSASDTAPDNSGWNTSSYPAQDASNKTEGVRFNVSTAGYSNILVSFESRVSDTASKYSRLQYTTNGTDFIDLLLINMPSNETFFAHSASLGSIPEADNNPNFGIRIVTEFESTATGSGTNGYVTTTTNSYRSNGTIRFDLVTFSGDSLQPNNPPTITDLPNQVITENTSTGDIPFTIGDAETPSNLLMLTGSSSNTNLVPNGNIHFSGENDSRFVNITPASNQIGSATITITVTDQGGKSTNTAFVLTVNPLNFPPTISSIAHQHTLVNTPTPPIAFRIGDAESDPDTLTLSASSSNPTLVSMGSFAFGGSGTNRTVVITPASNEVGTAAITILVSDGSRTGSTHFVLMVIPNTNVLLCESFSYADGSLITNSAFFWDNHGGIMGQLPVSSGQIQVTFAQNEDVDAPLIGAPWGPDSAILYARFGVNFSALPLGSGGYFAHYNAGTFRCRVFAMTNGAAAGAFRLGIANGDTTANAVFPLDLQLNTNYTIVTRYNIDSATSTLWINPTSESDSSATASDSATAVSVSAFSFRQNAGIGTMTIDNLKVGTSFESIVSVGPSLQIFFASNEIQVSWPEASSEGYILQSTESLSSPSWNTVLQEPTVADGTKTVRFLDVTGNQFFRLIKP